ncbi:hypothetical protein FHX37_2484 [Haloactinospora alba]|uniref:Uncharacterized protein n=1 Tax=Haloactinospora alba TaxID=405555 RepID=A0A543NL22_9ACTN|nr:hypothetical protein FHX37_2484 [Haloactinospora alba]
MEKANTDPEWFEKYYKSNGHRRDTAFLDENGNTLPQLTRASEGDPWISKDTLPPPEKPDYLGETEYGDRDHASPGQREELDRFAQERREAIDRANETKSDLRESENNHPEGLKTKDEHPTVTEKRQEYASAQHDATKKSEAFGEKVAEQAVLERYPDAEKVEIPDTAPKNGNDQFDQIWKTKDGKYIVVEAKSDASTPLGERTIKNENGEPKRTSQGTREYFDDTLEKMRNRGARDTNNKTEQDIAKEIERARKKGKIEYVEIKGNPKNEKYNGYKYKKFNIN